MGFSRRHPFQEKERFDGIFACIDVGLRRSHVQQFGIDGLQHALPFHAFQRQQRCASYIRILIVEGLHNQIQGCIFQVISQRIQSGFAHIGVLISQDIDQRRQWDASSKPFQEDIDASRCCLTNVRIGVAKRGSDARQIALCIINNHSL